MLCARRVLRVSVLISAVVFLMGGARGAFAADDPRSTEELLRIMKKMEQRLQVLEGQLQQKEATPPTPAAPATAPASYSTQSGTLQGAQSGGDNTTQDAPQGAPPLRALAQRPPENMPSPAVNKDIFGILPSPIEGLKLGMYGEFKFGTQQNPDRNGQWQSGFDMARIVLLPTFQFTDSIIFNAEIEFEHAGSGFDNDDKLHGTAEIEQAWVDFKINPYVNIRAPGIDLVPIGYTNLYHEPTLFYSVNRPVLADGLIPTTWASPAMSVYGKILDGLNYQVQVSASLEDFGSGFDARTSGHTVPAFPTGYAPGIDGKTALAFGTPPRGDFAQLSNDLATTVRLSFNPPFIPGFAGSTSVYYTPNTTPRGAYADDGTPLKRSNLTLVDTEFRYRIPETGLELRGEYAQVFFGRVANLRANNDTDPTNNVGRSMYGLSGEVAYHIVLGRALGAEWEAVPYYRYTYQNLQTGGFRGTDLNTPTGSGQQQYHTMGVAVFPTRKLVLKLDYQKVLDRQVGGCKCDSVLGGIGFFF